MKKYIAYLLTFFLSISLLIPSSFADDNPDEIDSFIKDFDIMDIAFDWYPIDVNEEGGKFKYHPKQIVFVGKSQDEKNEFLFHFQQIPEETPVTDTSGNTLPSKKKMRNWKLNEATSYIKVDSKTIGIEPSAWELQTFNSWSASIHLDIGDGTDVSLSPTLSTPDYSFSGPTSYVFNDGNDFKELNKDPNIEEFYSETSKQWFSSLKSMAGEPITGPCELEGNIKGCVLTSFNDDDTFIYMKLPHSGSSEPSIFFISGTTGDADGYISIKSDYKYENPTYKYSYLDTQGQKVETQSTSVFGSESGGVTPQPAVCSLQDILAKKPGCLTPEQQKALEAAQKIDPTKNLQQFALGGISQKEAQSGGSGIQQFGLIGQNIQIGAADSARIQELEQMQESGEIIRCIPKDQDGKSFETCQEELQYLRSLTGFGAIESTLQRFVNFALGFIEILALIILLYGALIWITAGGNDEKVDKGRTIILWSAIGLVIAIVAHVVITVVIQVITGLGD